MLRYIKLYFSYMKLSMVSKLEYKQSTFITLLSFIFTNACSIASIYFIINSIPALVVDGHNWDIYHLGFLYGFSMLPVSLDHLLTDDLWLVAYRKVKNGDIDRLYLRPLPVLFQVIAETFQPEGFGETIVGIVMITLCSLELNISWTFSMVFMLVIATIFGAMIITSLKIIFSSLAFPFKTSGPALQVVYNFITYTRYPLGIFPAFIKAILLFLFPFALVISLPIETLFFNSYQPYVLSLIIVCVAIFLFALSIFIWSRLAKLYQSSGS